MSDQPPQGGMTAEQAQGLLQAVLRSPLPRFYVNSFINASTSTDVMSVSQCNGQPVCIVNMSYVAVKTLMGALNTLVQDYEKRHNLTIPVESIGTAPMTAFGP